MEKKPSTQFDQLMQRYEKATGKSRYSRPYIFGRRMLDGQEPAITHERLAEIKRETERFMGFRASSCPRCGFGLYEDQIILEQRIVEVNDAHCVILETRRCRTCNHRYSVEMHYRPGGERFITNEHNEVK